MQHIEFSEMTNRLHRNIPAAASLIIAIGWFDVQIGKAGAMGIEIKNLTHTPTFIVQRKCEA
jgi:hypothetical protein